MNSTAGRIRSRNLRLRSLCLAVAVGLALPWVAMAQEAQPPTAQAESEPAEEAASGELFSIEDSDEPERLKELIQISSSAELGVFHVSDDSFRFGRYNGYEQQGPGLILNLDFFKRGAWDGNSASYIHFTTSDLGRDTREAALEFGEQGRYKVLIDHDQLPNFKSDSARTPFIGAGGSELTLPSNWVPSANTAGMTQLLPSLQPVDLRTQRRRTGLGFTGILKPHWDFSTSFKHETKEGIKTIGAVFGNSGGNPRAAIVPEPVDYTTDQFDAKLSYTTRTLQVQAAYYLSRFSDHNGSLVWTNPYSTIGGWATGTGYPSQGQLSLPPDNKFHQFSLNVGYNFSDDTRFSGSFSRGRMTQDEGFLPYSYIPSLQASITQPLPRGSLDGRIDTTVVNLRLSSRPWEDFSWSASYRYDDRDNKTPRDEYVYIGGDTQLQQTGLTSNRRRYNEPYSFKERQFKLDASYRVWGHTDLSAGVQHSRVDRTYSEREEADETTYNLGIKTAIGERFSGQLRYTHAKRDGSTYIGFEPFHSGYSEGYVATTPGWENHPALRKYFLANRDRDLLNASMSFTPTEAWTFSASVDSARDEYNQSELGLTDSRIKSYSLDTVYAPSPLWSTYAFYTYEKLDSSQTGHSISGGASQIPTSSDLNRRWFVDHLDRIDSYGLGFKRSSSSGKLDFGIDYVNSKSRSDLDFAVGSALLTAPLPRDETRLKSLNLHATYKVQANLSLRAGLWYEDFDSTDWSVDGIEPNQLHNVILLGEDSPDYNVYVVSFSAIFRF